MTTNNDHIDELIAKYLAQEAAADEVDFVESWANANVDNKKYFDQIRTIFEKATLPHETQLFDTDAAWDKIRPSLRSSISNQVRVLPGSVSGSRLMWKVAASIIVVLGAGLFIYQSLKPKAVTQITMESAKEVVSDTLPDGSSIVLNKDSKLAYTFDRKKKAHTVQLKGEAYFTIQHDENEIFIVDIDGVFIRDIGTSFNVRAYPETNTIEVVVETGEVMFYTDKDSGVYLRENGKGVYNRLTRSFTIDQPDANVLAYKTRVFNFSNAELPAIVESLNRVYDRKIKLSQGLEKCHLTVAFDNEDQDEIVAVIAETLGLTIEVSEESIVLNGPGCEDD